MYSDSILELAKIPPSRVEFLLILKLININFNVVPVRVLKIFVGIGVAIKSNGVLKIVPNSAVVEMVI